jgi:Glutaredoxin
MNTHTHTHLVSQQDGKPVGSVAGADAPALTTAVQQFAAAAGTKGAATALAPPPLAPPSAQAPSVEERIKVLLSSSPVVLFMKGNAAAPYCGFSRRTVEALRSAGASAFTDVDILRDEELRWDLGNQHHLLAASSQRYRYNGCCNVC